MSPIIAAFDCDGTLIRGDATRRFLLLLQGPLGLMRFVPQLLPPLMSWLLRRISTGRMKEILLNLVLQGTSEARRRSVVQEHLPIALRHQLRPKALARLRFHQQRGDRCLIVTASPEPLIRSLAKELGVELIGTRCSDPLALSSDQTFTLESANCKGPEKLHRLKEHLGYLPSPEGLEAYGDSKGDRELLNASQRPHFCSFNAEPCAYRPSRSPLHLFIALLAVILLLTGLRVFMTLSGQSWIVLSQALERLLQWLPAIYSLLFLSYVGRYWRWRCLLGSVGIGQWGYADALGWFQGFALTATPGKLGELSRVAQLHQHLGYARLPMTHAFVAERLCDAGAVVIWLMIATPALLTTLLASTSSSGLLLMGGVVVAILIILHLQRRQDGARLRQILRAWQKHRPSKAMARACLPALPLSLAFWALEGLILWLLVVVLSPIPITPLQGIGIYLLSGTAGVLSNIPGGIGINEAATVFFLQEAGVDALIGLPIAILRRLVTIWSITMLATLSQGLRLPTVAP